jgi:multidrug efflux pump
VVGGMFTATVLAIFCIPLFFVLVRRGVREGARYIRERRRGGRAVEAGA